MGGTVEYLAPEAVGYMSGQAHSEPVLLRESQDTYALGVVLYQVLARDELPPFAMPVSGVLAQKRPRWYHMCHVLVLGVVGRSENRRLVFWWRCSTPVSSLASVIAGG